MPEASRRVVYAHLGMMLWALLVGLSFPAVGWLTEGLPPLLLTAVRFAIAALALLPFIWQLPGRWPGLRGLALYAALGLCLAGFFGIMFWAAHRVSALSMATLFVCVPLLAYCLGRGLGVENPAGRLLAVLALGALGALALGWAESGESLGQWRFGRGEMIFLLGCVASALYPVLSKWGISSGRLSSQALLRAFWSLLAGCLLVGLLGLVWEAPDALAKMAGRDVLLLVYLGVFSSSMTFWLQQRATAVLTPGVVAAYSYTIPFVSMLLLFSTEPQRMGWQWLPGSLLVVLAIGLLLRRESQSVESAG